MLSDLAKHGEDGDGGKLAVEVKVTPLDPMIAMSRLVKAIHANDIESAYDAFCLLHEAHADRLHSEPDGDEDGDEEY